MKLFICGDSFCVDDHDYGDSWVDLLVKKLPAHIEVTNLASSGASNYLIYLQVKQALQSQCDYLIYHATSSIRQEFRLADDHQHQDSAARYWNDNNPNKDARMICGSWLGIDRHYKELLTLQQTDIINLFFQNFVDLPNLVEKNYIFIRHTLEMISASSVRWAWTPGGFEHPRFGASKIWDFDHYQANMCPINLWDHYVASKVRPWFHITDPEVQQNVCDQYIKMLKCNDSHHQRSIK